MPYFFVSVSPGAGTSKSFERSRACRSGLQDSIAPGACRIYRNASWRRVGRKGQRYCPSLRLFAEMSRRFCLNRAQKSDHENRGRHFRLGADYDRI